MRAFVFSFSAIFFLASPQARAAFPLTALKPVCLKQIHSPTTITYAPDGSGRLFICDQPGQIYIIEGGMMLPTPFLDISPTAPNASERKVIDNNTGYSERGLLCVVFHPGYANSASPGYRKFYVNYVKPYVSGVDPTPNTPGSPSDSVSVIAEFQVSAGNPNVADPNSERRLLLYTQPQSNHNGGQLEFGPEVGPSGERYLYIGVGDGGSQQDNNLGHTGGSNIAPRPTNGLGNAQDKTRIFGKILRIDPLGTDGPGGQYGIPVSNPFVGVGGAVREEIYSYGMRNPWKFSFDKRPGGTNRLFCGDVGGDRTEEINLIVSGGNYGWRYKEGVELPLFSSGAPTNPMVLPPAEVAAMIGPIARYAHPGQTVERPALPQLGYSVTGGYVYRGAAIPALQGKFVFGDYGQIGLTDGRLMGLEETAPLSGVFTLTQAIPILGKPLTAAGALLGERILCLGEDESGEIYVGLKTNNGVLQVGTDGLPAGGIYKIVPVQSFTTTLQSSKDNTIFAEDLGLGRDYSDGVGYLYAGRTGSNFGPYVRRVLVAFNLAADLPSSAVIQSVQLQLNLNKAGSASGGTSLSVHRVTESWGEGSSVNISGGYGAPATPNDATWKYRLYNTSSWLTPGGSFNATASATAVQSGGPFLTWTSAQLKADVQAWLDSPASNAGWMIRGNENTNLTACQFSSRQAGGVPPALTITYDAAPALTYRETWLQTYFPVGQFVDGGADLDGDGLINKFEYAFAFSPLAADPADASVQVSSTYSGDDVVFTIIFRRDPRATELTYILETSSDLVTWTPLVTSVAGAAPTGTGFLFEGDASGEAPVKNVFARETVPAGQNRYARVRVLP
ncbi:MAG: PQQ-dependent sugar dehydrogenase [Chthoniobacteraceae bacterium]